MRIVQLRSWIFHFIPFNYENLNLNSHMYKVATVLESESLEAHQWTIILPLKKLETPSSHSLRMGLVKRQIVVCGFFFKKKTSSTVLDEYLLCIFYKYQFKFQLQYVFSLPICINLENCWIYYFVNAFKKTNSKYNMTRFVILTPLNTYS